MAPMMDLLPDRLRLELPGLWINLEDGDLAWNASLLMGSALHQYNEAVVACLAFTPLHAAHIEAAIQNHSITEDPARLILISLYAKSFVYALDAARAFISVLEVLPGLPDCAKAKAAAFTTEFELVREIRNSLQHIEERAQGLGRNKKRLPTAVLDLGSFVENRLSITIDGGGNVQLEISEPTLARVRTGLSRVLWSLPWLGPGSIPVPVPLDLDV
jgi:hypothetical protein